MSCYKDTTYCPGPCDNKKCFRHLIHIDHDYLKVHSYIPVAWFLELPKDCPDYIPPEI